MLYRCAQFELDTAGHEFRAGGTAHWLEPQVFDLLQHFLQNPNRVISRDELIDAVWGGRIVSDATISTRINAVRKALGDTGQRQDFIQTLPRRGFKFVAPVDEIATDDAGRGSDGSWESGTAGRPSVAVLPFTSLPGDVDQEFFADGVWEDIITGLSRYRSLIVMARNSVSAYKGRAVDHREIAREMGVRYILEGSVRRAGRRVRITAHLVEIDSGADIWAERYDREIEDLFAVQDDVTDAIVRTIAPEIGDAERRRTQRRPPESLGVWERYQRGLADFYRSTEESLWAAITEFDEVNALDPHFAPGFAMAAGARWRLVLHFQPEEQERVLRVALEKSYNAVEKDPRDPSGHWNAAEVHSILGDHASALEKANDAIALNPHDAMSRYFLGSVLCRAGGAEQAMPHFDKAMELSPRDMFRTGMLTHRAFALFELGRFDDALTWARRARNSPNPRSMTFAVLAAILARLGQVEEARQAVQELSRHAPRMTCDRYRKNAFGAPASMEALSEALRQAGLPC